MLDYLITQSITLNNKYGSLVNLELTLLLEILFQSRVSSWMLKLPYSQYTVKET